MKQDTKIIIIGISVTLLLLIIAFLIFYIIYQNENKQTTIPVNNTTEPEKAETQNQDTQKENTQDQIEETTNNENTNENNQAENQVTLYLFHGEECPHCEHAIEFLKSITDDYSYLNIITYEVWHNTENKKLMDEVATRVGLEVSEAVPLIVIGTNYADRGFGEGLEDILKEEFENAHTSSEYEDIIKDILEENQINVTEETIK